MLSTFTFFEGICEMVFGTPETKKASKNRTRTLRIEELESREMLSATPMPWDWIHDIAPTITTTDVLPSGYQIDPTSEDFGKISLGGNNSPIDATTAFTPVLTDNFVAIETVSQQKNTSIQTGNDISIAGTSTETITVGVFYEDYGNGDWYYEELAAYTYNITADGHDYWGGYFYTFTASFYDGIYESAFSLTSEDHFSISDTVNESSLSLTITASGNVKDMVLITHYHDTLTSVRNGTDQRTSTNFALYDGNGTYASSSSENGVSVISTGTLKLNGSNQSSSSFQSQSTFHNGSWSTSGSGCESGSSNETSSYSGKDNFTITLDDPSGSGSGVAFYTDKESTTSSWSANWSLQNDTWSRTSGTGTATDSSGNYLFYYESGSASDSGCQEGVSYSMTSNWDFTEIEQEQLSALTLNFHIVNGDWEVASGSGTGYVLSGWSSGDTTSGDYSFDSDGYVGTGFRSDSNNSATVVEMNLTYQWSGGAWITTGTAMTGDEFGYDRFISESGTHDTGETSYSEHSVYNEQVYVYWNYDGCTWTLDSVEGEGTGTYSETYYWDSSTTYERPFYITSSITETVDTFIDYTYDANWDTSFIIVGSQVIRETEGMYTESHATGCSFSGSGTHSASTSSTSQATSLSESNEQSYSEIITGAWSNKVNQQGTLVSQHTADSEITVKSSRNYDFSHDASTEGPTSGLEWSVSFSEWYDSEHKENYHYDGGAWYLVSFDGEANGGGTSNCSWSSWNHSECYHEDGCYYCDYTYESSFDSSCDVSYAFTAEWSGDTNGSSYSLTNDVTKNFESVEEWSRIGVTGYIDWNGNKYGQKPFHDEGGSECSYECSQTLSTPGWGGWATSVGNWSPFSGMPYIGGGNCFVAGTQVVIGAEFDENDVFVQYVTKNIEDINVGDLVYCYNTETETVEQKEVTAVFVREIDHINYLTIEDENGDVQVLEVTDVHPFWVVTDDPDLERAARDFVGGMYHHNIAPTENGFWVEAKDLREGDVFLGANGELSTLVAIERVELEESITVYNFTVEGNHNYFVIAETDENGQTSVLVHNADPLYNFLSFKSDLFDLSIKPKVRFSDLALDWKDFGQRLLNEPFWEALLKIVGEICSEVGKVGVTGVGVDVGVKLNTGPFSGWKVGANIGISDSPTTGKPEGSVEIYIKKYFPR